MVVSRGLGCGSVERSSLPHGRPESLAGGGEVGERRRGEGERGGNQEGGGLHMTSINT